jgi:hypothetical protein
MNSTKLALSSHLALSFSSRIDFTIARNCSREGVDRMGRSLRRTLILAAGFS